MEGGRNPGTCSVGAEWVTMVATVEEVMKTVNNAFEKFGFEKWR